MIQGCPDGQELDINGICREINDCSAECNGGTGTIQANFGICQCDDITTSLQACDADCQETLPTTTFTSEGLLLTYDPVTKRTINTT